MISMRILWVCPLFLHPTTKGGQIRTLETLRQLHQRHEIHFAGLANPNEPEGVERSVEYCTQSYSAPHQVPDKKSLAFLGQAAAGVFSAEPLAVSRFRSEPLRALVGDLMARLRFDSIVCDFLAAAPNIPRLEDAVLFQHNVETTIWERHAENAANPLYGAMLRSQARKMFRYERGVCRAVRHVIAVSDKDAARMRSMFGADRVSDVPTGVDIDYFAPPPMPEQTTELVFVGSMDWAPNIDGVLYFVREILPLIHRERPDCRVTIVGRTPPHAILELARSDSRITVTGTTPDIRPYVWGSAISIVPLRIGGGTRLKIFESMAAKVPVVSTTVGAEGLPLVSGEHLFLADAPEEFAGRCLELLASPSLRGRLAGQGWRLVNEAYSWGHAARRFEEILASAKDVR